MKASLCNKSLISFKVLNLPKTFRNSLCKKFLKTSNINKKKIHLLNLLFHYQVFDQNKYKNSLQKDSMIIIMAKTFS